MKNLSADNYTAPDLKHVRTNPNTEDKFKAISNTTPDVESEDGFVTKLNGWMFKAMNSTMYIANKFGELEIGSKIINTGSAVVETGSTIIDKGTEVAVNIV